MYKEEKREFCECGVRAMARGMCASHYQKMRRSGKISIHHATALDTQLKKILANINLRCNYPKTNKYEYYGGKGIKNFLTLDDIKYLWFRDGAEKLKQPSIDRIDSNKNYERNNCQFIEFRKNIQNRFLGKQFKCILCGAPRKLYDEKCDACKIGRRCKICKNYYLFTEKNCARLRCGKCNTFSRSCSFCGTIVVRFINTQNWCQRSRQIFCNRKCLAARMRKIKSEKNRLAQISH